MRVRLSYVLAAIVVGLSGAAVARAARPVGPPPTAAIGPVADSVAFESQLRKLADLVDSTGGLGVDRTSDGGVVVVVPASGSSSFTSSKARALGIDVSVRRSPIEGSEVAAIKAFATQLQVSAFFDVTLGKVVVATDSQAAASSLASRFPGKIHVLNGTGRFASRDADFNDHWGGAKMRNSTTTCTSGFSVLNANGDQRMVTAGHCFAYQDVVVSPGGDSFGHVTSRQFSATTDMDSELVGANGATMGPAIYRGGATGSKANVRGASDPVQGATYCYSGVRRYEQCEQVVRNTDAMLCGPDPVSHQQVCIDHLTLVWGPGICYGDSGGPLFSIATDGVIIRGTVSGFPDTLPPDQRDASGCTQKDVRGNYEPYWNYFEPWSRIRDYFGATIMKVP
jgi:hypothetical protein